MPVKLTIERGKTWQPSMRQNCDYRIAPGSNLISTPAMAETCFNMIPLNAGKLLTSCDGEYIHYSAHEYPARVEGGL